MNWENVININDLQYRKEQISAEYIYETSSLADRAGAVKLGFHAEVLPPASFSCPYHFHHFEEELFLVLDGRAMLRQAGEYREVVKGDLIFFPPGPQYAHQFHNHTQEPFRFLALSTVANFEVCEYPDSHKVFVRKLDKVFQSNGAIEYNSGEQTPKSHWPDQYLNPKLLS